MRKVSFKKGVCLFGLQQETLFAIDVCARIFDANDISFVITSAKDGVHSDYSLHYKGFAFDIRVWEIPNDITAYCQKILHELGINYQVLNEDDHIHVEYDPKRLPL